MENVGTRLKIARFRSGLSQEEVIERLARRGFAITQVSLLRYENDHREIGLDLLKQLSLIYGVPVQELIWSREEIEMYSLGGK